MFGTSFHLIGKFGIAMSMLVALISGFSTWDNANSGMDAINNDQEYIVSANAPLLPDDSNTKILADSGQQTSDVDTEIPTPNEAATPKLPPTIAKTVEKPTSETPDSNKNTQNNLENTDVAQEEISVEPTKEADISAEEDAKDDHDHKDKEEHDHDEVIIAYTPTTITPVAESSAPLNTLELNENQVQPFGFSESNIVNGQTINLNQVVNVTIPPKANTAVLDHIVIEPATPINVSTNRRNASVSLQNPQRDQNYTIGIKAQSVCVPDMESECNAKETWAYKLDFKTTVLEEFLLGKSVENRDIWGYKLGRCRTSNCTKIMMTGAIHGSEYRSGDLPQLISYINNNQHEISGQDKEFYIIPVTNPDGKERNIRYNARGVNLNRNFSSLWEPCAQCGSAAYSEPESLIVKNETYSFMPKYLLSYHAQWPPNGIIFRGNDNNQRTIDFANYVADRTGYPVGYFPDFDNVPGDQTVWAETYGISSLIIEATRVENTDWDKNFNLYLSLLRENI